MGPWALAVCKRYLPQVQAVTTVCDGIADAYEELCGVHPAVITNATEFRDLTPQFRQDGRDPIRLVHHGAAIPSRRLEAMVEMMRSLDSRFHLTFFLTGNPAYRKRLASLAKNLPVEFRDPVAMNLLPETLNEFDIGLFLLPPTNFNYQHALPNKLFEFIQARLGVGISPSPEMARVVNQIECGVIALDFTPQALAQCLQSLNHDVINGFKAKAHAGAKHFHADRNRTAFLELVDRLLHASQGQDAFGEPHFSYQLAEGTSATSLGPEYFI
jgi:hypothetical protein